MEEPLRGRLEGKNIDRAAGILRSGGVAVLPTDTIYGFHCACSSREAIDRIIRLKGRRKSAGLILLASSPGMAEKLVSKWPPGAEKGLRTVWPAPVTAILPASEDLPVVLRPKGKVAVRVPDMPELLRLIRRAGEPLVSTSVNRTGEPPLNSMAAILREFSGLDAYLGRIRPGGRAPSTIVDLTGKRPEIVRQGAGKKEVRAAFRMT